ncbi:AbiH family protein [Levilactobacillus tujiorum]|uniref:Bacteriophage abortive infection AbiH n=1 Tax=Levilactobacillus tujiorum TaxID=2912243 RepID=A0ABX1L3C4_9LACO|nr:AbiH family protein [Levilactobacillus tujiorum]MCH5464080.1 hypothetical protein [Levilactobacillus tujiorum]NLR11180.1 hypothetical protein [Lactobacillus sp. HBUAS51387]NLR29193.1 hypothetical protein [Levilactobacillus tujiorum]
MTVKRLVILGNGFDIKSGLKSRLTDYWKILIENGQENLANLGNDYNNEDVRSSDFVDSIHMRIGGNGHSLPNIKDAMDTALNGLTFWELWLYLGKNKHENWADIERYLEEFLTRSDEYQKSFAEKVDKELLMYREEDEYRKNRRLFDNPSFGGSFSTDVNVQKAVAVLVGNFQYDCLTHTTAGFYALLLEQLHQFENRFADYMMIQIDGNDKYDRQSEQLLKEISNGETFNLLSFNYTEPTDTIYDLDQKANVHGTLKSHPIIGIDSRQVQANSPWLRFTKTYRIMSLAKDREMTVLERSINTICFYGNSLAPADYSYFQSIFDFFDIYENQVTLVFFYSTYPIAGLTDEEAKDKISGDQFDAVSRLLEKYGDTFQNEKGKNLLHKLFARESDYSERNLICD